MTSRRGLCPSDTARPIAECQPRAHGALNPLRQFPTTCLCVLSVLCVESPPSVFSNLTSL